MQRLGLAPRGFLSLAKTPGTVGQEYTGNGWGTHRWALVDVAMFVVPNEVGYVAVVR